MVDRERVMRKAFSLAREHSTHDVIAGAAIGIVSRYIFTRPNKGWHFQLEAGENGFRLGPSW
jgi:hypothetical protein